MIDLKTAPEQWDAHRRECDSCRQYRDGTPATLAHVCLRGAPLIKAVLELNARPASEAKRKQDNLLKRQMLGKEYCSAAKMKRLMRYVEPDDAA